MGAAKLRRVFTRNAGFSLTAVIVLALGIGANTAMFSVVRAVLVNALPYPEPERIVVVAETNRNGRHIQVSGADARDWRAQAKSFEAMAMYFCDTTPVVAAGAAERLKTCAAGQGWFNALGVKPQLGRTFLAGEEQAGGERTAVISEGLWRRAFAGRPGVLGEKIKAMGAVHTVVGVMPAGFRFPGKSDVWISLGHFADTSARSAHNYRVIARLKSGVSADQAASEMKTIAANLAAAYPDSNREIGAAVVPLAADLTSGARPTLYLLLASVGFVLLIACANTGNLLLASGARRRTEFAIRASLGATRGAIVRQLMGESLALAAAGGALGILLAWWSRDLLVSLAPGDIPRLAETRIDWAVLAFGVGVSFAAGILFGLVPAFGLAKEDLNGALKQGARTMGATGAGLRSALVCAEIAFSVVLVVGAGLAIRTLAALQRVSPGYSTRNVAVMDISVPPDEKNNGARPIGVFQEFLRRARALPGVRAAGVVSSVPLSDGGSSNGLFIREGQAKFDKTQWAGFHTADAGYFRVLGVPLRAGREFSERDRFDAPRVAIISESAARKYWPGGGAVGSRITTGYDFDSKDMTIVGIVGDVRHESLGEAPRPEIYVPFQQHPVRAAELSAVIGTTGADTGLAEALGRTLRSVEPESAMEFSTLDRVMSSSIGPQQFRATLLGLFAVLALSLAAVGVYGLLSFIAGQRVPEIGLRMALGATGGDVVRLVLRSSLKLVGVGLAIGVAGSLVLTRYMAAMLYGVKPADPGTYILVCAILTVAAVAASYAPARRASRIDPVKALRSE